MKFINELTEKQRKSLSKELKIDVITVMNACLQRQKSTTSIRKNYLMYGVILKKKVSKNFNHKR